MNNNGYQDKDMTYSEENTDVLLGGAGDEQPWGGCKSIVAIDSRAARACQIRAHGRFGKKKHLTGAAT